MKTTTALFPLPSALLCFLISLTPIAPLSAADPTTLPAPVLDTAKAIPTTEATAPSVAVAPISPFIARPAPASNVAASLDTTKTTNPADKPQYVFTWFLNNYLGTTIASSNAAEEIAEIETDAFGAPLARGTLPADMRYTGKPYDEDMGAYIFPFRNYRPDEARWMTPDPAGFPDGKNNYRYVDNPVREIDILGTLTVEIYDNNADEFEPWYKFWDWPSDAHRGLIQSSAEFLNLAANNDINQISDSEKYIIGASSLDDAVTQLNNLGINYNSITNLAIWAHGSDGVQIFGGNPVVLGYGGTNALMGYVYGADVDYEFADPLSLVRLMGCNAGAIGPVFNGPQVLQDIANDTGSMVGAYNSYIIVNPYTGAITVPPRASWITKSPTVIFE